jgi:RNA polymerase sigma-70 factor, ECF subfamily
MTVMETVPGPVSSARVRGATAACGGDLARLLARTARGDHDAFAAVYDHAAPALFGAVRGVIRDPFLAEEVTQEVFLEVWRTASRFNQARGSAFAWMATIAHRRAVDRVRSEQRMADRDRRATAYAIAFDEVAESAEHNLERERVRHCLKRLTELQREAVTMAYYGGRTYREVAALLGVPAGTVSTRMRDGLIRLRDCLGVAR